MRLETKALVATVATLVLGGTAHAAISGGDGAAGDPPGELFFTRVGRDQPDHLHPRSRA